VGKRLVQILERLEVEEVLITVSNPVYESGHQQEGSVLARLFVAAAEQTVPIINIQNDVRR
jgi:hypothetical protein